MGKTEELRENGEYSLHLTKSKALCPSVHSPGRCVCVRLRASPSPGEVGEAPEAKLASSRAAKCNQALYNEDGCDRGGGIWSEFLLGDHISLLDMLGTSDLSCAPDSSVVNQLVQSSAAELALSEQTSVSNCTMLWRQAGFKQGILESAFLFHASFATNQSLSLLNSHHSHSYLPQLSFSFLFHYLNIPQRESNKVLATQAIKVLFQSLITSNYLQGNFHNP